MTPMSPDALHDWGLNRGRGERRRAMAGIRERNVPPAYSEQRHVNPAHYPAARTAAARSAPDTAPDAELLRMRLFLLELGG